MSSEHTHDEAIPARFGAPPEFLKTHRAITACARELEALADAMVDAVDAWHASGLEHKPAARRSPGRCAIQLGPVALTFAWLRGAGDDITAGQLLVIVWHGSVGPRRDHRFERVAHAPIPHTATQLWEAVFRAGTVGTDTWRWLGEGEPSVAHTANSLASYGVERLREAYLAHCPPATVAGDLPSAPEVQ